MAFVLMVAPPLLLLLLALLLLALLLLLLLLLALLLLLLLLALPLLLLVWVLLLPLVLQRRRRTLRFKRGWKDGPICPDSPKVSSPHTAICTRLYSRASTARLNGGSPNPSGPPAGYHTAARGGHRAKTRGAVRRLLLRPVPVPPAAPARAAARYHQAT